MNSNSKNSNAVNLTPKERRNLILTIVITALIVLIVVMIILVARRSNEQENDDLVSLTENEKIEETSNEQILENLYDMTEQERITYYCAEFFKYAQQKDYEAAYDLLYDEYTENYFPTESSFEVYMNDYFPNDYSLEYTNIERLGEIYVLWVDVKDTDGTKFGHNFSMNVVIREDDYNDFVLSFSRNSAVDSL